MSLGAALAGAILLQGFAPAEVRAQRVDPSTSAAVIVRFLANTAERDWVASHDWVHRDAERIDVRPLSRLQLKRSFWAASISASFPR